MGKKNIILVIVEGNSDERLLDSILNKIDTSEINTQYKVLNGDFFTQKGTINGKNIISEIIKGYIIKSKIPAKNISMVKYLVDVDGMFLDKKCLCYDKTKPDDYFQYDQAQKKVFFGSESKKQDVVSKWDRKKRRLEQVWSDNFFVSLKQHQGTSKKKKIPVKVYFNNLTLEHTLVNKVLRGEDATDEKMNIVTEFISQLEKKDDVLESALSFFEKLVPDHAESNEVAWKKLEYNPWIKGSTIYFLIQDCKQALLKNIGS